MYVPEEKPILKTKCGLVVDNLSLDGKVWFKEEGHAYGFVPSEDNGKTFTSATTKIKDFYEPYDEEYHADRISKKRLTKYDKYYGMSAQEILDEWDRISNIALEDGSMLHAYGEGLLDGWWKAPRPDHEKAIYVEQCLDYIKNTVGLELAKTEILVYSKPLMICGQSDILYKSFDKDGNKRFHIYDWKFLKEPLQKKSFFDWKTKKFTMMLGMFRFLMDTDFYHYSIQLSIYEYLTGVPHMVDTKVLCQVTPKGYELVPTLPMRVYYDEWHQFQTIYMIPAGGKYGGRIYSSKSDYIYPRDYSFKQVLYLEGLEDE